MKVEIRKANKYDLKKISNKMLSEFSKSPFNEKHSLKEVMKSLKFYFRIGEIFLIKKEEKILGGIVFKIEEWWEGKVLIIEDLFGDSEKINMELLNFVEEYAEKKSYEKICFSTNKKSKGIKNYKKKGYKLEKNTIFMFKNLK